MWNKGGVVSKHKYCPKCGSRLKKDVKFCHRCGFELVKKLKVKEKIKSPIDIKLISIGVVLILVVVSLLIIFYRPTVQPSYYQPQPAKQIQSTIRQTTTTLLVKECFDNPQIVSKPVCDNYQETRTCIKDGIQEMEEAIERAIAKGYSMYEIRQELPEELGIAYTNGKYVLTYVRREGKTFFEIVPEGKDYGVDVGFEEDLRAMGITVTRFERWYWL